MLTLTPTNLIFRKPITDSFVSPKCTFIPYVCFNCRAGDVDIRSMVMPTEPPRYMVYTCGKPECAAVCVPSAVSFFRTTGTCMLLNPFVDTRYLEVPLEVQRTSGVVETDWTVYGFVFEDSGAVSHIVGIQPLTNCVKKMQTHTVLSTNEHAIPLIQEALDDIVDDTIYRAQTLWSH